MSWRALFRGGPEATRIEPLTADHAERLAEIHAAAFARPWSPPEFESFLADRAILADGIFLNHDRQPSGFVLSRRVADEAEVLSVALDRRARGRGHARSLMRHHLCALADLGIVRLHLEVEDGNQPAIALYGRLGFESVGRRPGYYTRPDGSRVAAVTMTRILG